MLNLQAAGFSQGKGFGLRGQGSVDPCCLFTSIQRPLFSCLHSLTLLLKVTAWLNLLHWQRKCFPPPWHKPEQLVVTFHTPWFLMLYQKHLHSAACAVCFSLHPHRDPSQNQCGATLPSMCREGFALICFSKPRLAAITNEKHQSLADRSASLSVNICGRS